MAVPDVAEIEVKSVLNRVKGMPFAWSINPYRGCAHGCVFCYARRTHTFLEEDGESAWSTRLYAKRNAGAVLRRELSRPSWRREEVAVGTATDPYQPIEARFRITRDVLAALAAFRTPASLVTRSPLVRRDVDVLQDLSRSAGVTVLVSVPTLDPTVAREIEPAVASPRQRLRAVADLASRGIHAGVLVAPVVPGLTDGPEVLESVLRAAADHGAHFVGHRVLYLGDVTRASFFRYLHARRPELVPLYERLFPKTYAPRWYQDEVGSVFRGLRGRVTLAPRPAFRPKPEPEQLSLLGGA
jgi:DNA repair photolyase